MIITQDDLDDFDEAYRRVCPIHDAPDWIDEDFLGWLVDNPQVCMASGFQEFIAGSRSQLFRELVELNELDNFDRPVFRSIDHGWVVPSTVNHGEMSGFRLEALKESALAAEKLHQECREGKVTPADRDHRQAKIDSHIIQVCHVEMPSCETMLENASKYLDNPLVDETLLVSPKIWTPKHQWETKRRLESSAVALINRIKAEKVDLNEVSWQAFEEIVAEVLRSSGMEIHLVKENPQGGRDIIARSWFAGEMLDIAVEVKHRRKVDKPELQKAINQNGHFPALMLVTSGSFTAGVRKVASRPENKMRVFLRDGVAIRDLIRTYRLKR